MKAWQYTVMGDKLASLNLNENAPAPSKASLSKDQIIVEVISASINPVDMKMSDAGLAGKLIVSLSSRCITTQSRRC